MTNTIYLIILLAMIVIVIFGDIKLADSLPDTMKTMKKKITDVKKIINP